MAERRESVRLDLTGNFTTEVAKAAVLIAALRKDVDGLAKSTVKARVPVSATTREVDNLGTSARRTGNAIDSMSGRVGILTDVALTLGPALAPVGAVAIPALATLATSMGAVVVGAGTMAVAFGGVGEALEAVNEAHLDPTVENLQAAEVAMDRLAPAAQRFVEQLDSMRGLGAQIRDAGAGALFPGLVDALEALESRGPDAIRIVEAFNAQIGEIAAEGAASLASDRWDDFFRMLEREGPRTLDSLAVVLGDVVHGATELLEAFTGLNRDGLGWLEGAARDFDRWATGLKNTEGFRDFVAYVREHGPQVAETIGALADALVAVVEAAAPLGGPALTAIEGMAESVAAIAASDFATPLLAAVAAMRAINRLAPGTGAALALVGGTAAGGGRGDGKPGGRRRPRVSAGGALAAALIVPEVLNTYLTEERGWEDATAKAETFSQKWGVSMGEQTEKVRTKLYDMLEVPEGRGPFGLLDNEQGLGEALSAKPIQEQIALQRDLRNEFGVTFRMLENWGVLPDGFTRGFRQARDDVHAFANDFERLDDAKAGPKVDVEDREARRKQREHDDWIMGWGRKNARAKADVDDKPARDKERRQDDWIHAWGRKNAQARVDVDSSPALSAIAALESRLRAIKDEDVFVNVRHTTTYSRRNNFGPVGGVANGGELAGGYSLRRAAAGAMVPKTGRPYADRHLYLLADGEHIVSNRHGQADRNREALEAANRGALLAIKGYADGGEVRQVTVMPSGGGGSQRSRSSLQVTGTLQTPWGPATIRGIALDAAEEVVGDYRAHDSRRAGTVYSGVGGD